MSLVRAITTFQKIVQPTSLLLSVQVAVADCTIANLVRYLLNFFSLDVNHTADDEHQKFALIYAVEANQSMGVISALVNAGSILENKHVSALKSALSYRPTKPFGPPQEAYMLCKYLLEKGADVNWV